MNCRSTSSFLRRPGGDRQPYVAAIYCRQSDKFACDMVVSSDGGQFGEDQPELLVGLRAGRRAD
ncbi:MAG: hypothetical protein R2911_30240 [Caldilineaceae bacterium]